MKFLNSLRATLISAIRHPKLWIVQFLGNVVILIIAGSWLHIPDAHWWELFFQFVIALAVIIGLLVLHGGTLNYFTDADANPAAGMGKGFKSALKHLPALVIFAAIFSCVVWLLGMLDDYQYSFPGYLRSEFPAWLRRHISEPGMDHFYVGFLAFLRWVVIPGLLLPLGLLCAGLGFRGFISFRAWGRVLGGIAYWVVLIFAALIGVYLNNKILHWLLNPDTSALGGQEVWFGFRLLVVYLLALLSWLWVCAMLAYTAGRPDPPAAAQKAAA